MSRPGTRIHTKGWRWLRAGIVAGLLGVLVLSGFSTAPSAHPERRHADTTKTREVHIVRADSLAGGVEGGERVQRLVGSVLLRQDSTWLWADRAVRYLDRDEIYFTGRVRIVEQGDSLSADTVRYDRRFKTGQARGRVRLADGDVEVFAPSGLFYTEEHRAVFREGVTLVDSALVLESEAGEYWTEEKRAAFFGDVRLDEDRTHLEADSVTYFRETEVSIARGNVYIERLGDEDEAPDADTTVRTLLFGEEAYNDNRAGYSRIEGRPLLVQLRADTSAAPPEGAGGSVDSLRADTTLAAAGRVDTLLVRAVVLEVSRIDSLDRLVAVDSVRIWQRDLAAVADSVVYDRVEVEGAPSIDEARFYRDPVAWFEASQVTGDTIRVKGRGGTIDTLFVTNNTFVAQRDTVLDRIHQIRGRDLVAVFADDTLRTLVIGPNAEAIRFQTDREDRPSGAVKASADRLTATFRDGKIARINYANGVEGTYYSESLLPDPFRLDGFRWEPEVRPTREQLLEGQTIPEMLIRPGLRPQVAERAKPSPPSRDAASYVQRIRP